MSRDLKRSIVGVVVAGMLMGSAAAAHHSYAAYHRDQIVEIDGVIEALDWVNPHSLLKVRTADTLYTFEWLAASAMARRGVERDTLKAGDRVIVTGNPHRDIAENGVVNLKTVRRPADGWNWPRSW
jgi:Family of unknown function (DUF6152)